MRRLVFGKVVFLAVWLDATFANDRRQRCRSHTSLSLSLFFSLPLIHKHTCRREIIRLGVDQCIARASRSLITTLSNSFVTHSGSNNNDNFVSNYNCWFVVGYRVSLFATNVVARPAQRAHTITSSFVQPLQVILSINCSLPLTHIHK
jgi:hypothetical protein